MNSIETIFGFLQDKWYLVLVVLVVGIWNLVNRDMTTEMKSRKCEHCASVIDLEVKTCKYCGKDQENRDAKSLFEENTEHMAANAAMNDWSWKKNRVPYIMIFLVLAVLIVLYSIE